MTPRHLCPSCPRFYTSGFGLHVAAPLLIPRPQDSGLIVYDSGAYPSKSPTLYKPVLLSKIGP